MKTSERAAVIHYSGPRPSTKGHKCSHERMAGWCSVSQSQMVSPLVMYLLQVYSLQLHVNLMKVGEDQGVIPFCF